MTRWIIGCCAVLMAATALLVPAREADAQCGRCSSTALRCEPYNYRKCIAGRDLKTGLQYCSEEAAACGFTYDAAAVGADGSLAAAGDAVTAAEATGHVRGCHGLIVARAYSVAQVARTRTATARISL